jgi:hypothetical protein
VDLLLPIKVVEFGKKFLNILELLLSDVGTLSDRREPILAALDRIFGAY